MNSKVGILRRGPSLSACETNLKFKYRHYYLLKKAHDRDPKVFGLFIQHLLAFTLCEELGVIITHYGRTDRHDIKFRFEDKLYVMEVRTTAKKYVDISDMYERLVHEKGLKRIAVFDLTFPTRWLIVKLDQLYPAKYIVSSLMIFLDADLTKRINSAFPRTVHKYYDLFEKHGESYIYELLRMRNLIPSR